MSKIKILIIEDEPIIALKLKHILMELDYETYGIANNRCNTLKLLEEKNENPDLILMDIYLQGSTTGIMLAKELKETLLPNVPVIFLTANSELSTIKEASQTMAYGYVIKPYKKSYLLAAIEVALEKSNEDNKKSLDLAAVKNINKSLEQKFFLDNETKSKTVKLKYGYLFDKENNILYYGDEPVKLTTKELAIISILCNKPGQNVTQEQMEYLVWQDEPAGYAAFRSILFRLRNKVHKDLITSQNNSEYRIELLNIDKY